MSYLYVSAFFLLNVIFVKFIMFQEVVLVPSFSSMYKYYELRINNNYFIHSPVERCWVPISLNDSQ